MPQFTAYLFIHFYLGAFPEDLSFHLLFSFSCFCAPKCCIAFITCSNSRPIFCIPYFIFRTERLFFTLVPPWWRDIPEGAVVKGISPDRARVIARLPLIIASGSIHPGRTDACLILFLERRSLRKRDRKGKPSPTPHPTPTSIQKL